MEKKLRVGILGATGMVGQRFITLLENHPWFEVVVVAASPRSEGKTYEEAVDGRWKMTEPLSDRIKKMVVKNVNNIEEISKEVDFVFSAVDMTKDEIKAIEEAYAKAEVPVVSNNCAHSWTPDVPMVVPEINPEHLEVIESQKKRLGTKRGFIVVKPNCSIQSYTPDNSMDRQINSLSGNKHQSKKSPQKNYLNNSQGSYISNVKHSKMASNEYSNFADESGISNQSSIHSSSSKNRIPSSISPNSAASAPI